MLSPNKVIPLVQECLWNVWGGETECFLTFFKGFSFIWWRKGKRIKVFAIAVKVLAKEPFYELELAF